MCWISFLSFLLFVFSQPCIVPSVRLLLCVVSCLLDYRRIRVPRLPGASILVVCAVERYLGSFDYNDYVRPKWVKQLNVRPKTCLYVNFTMAENGHSPWPRTLFTKLLLVAIGTRSHKVNRFCHKEYKFYQCTFFSVYSGVQYESRVHTLRTVVDTQKFGLDELNFLASASPILGGSWVKILMSFWLLR